MNAYTPNVDVHEPTLISTVEGRAVTFTAPITEVSSCEKERSIDSTMTSGKLLRENRDKVMREPTRSWDFFFIY